MSVSTPLPGPVAVVHQSYRSSLPSGENVVVEREAALLRAAGAEVQLHLRSSDPLVTGPLPARWARRVQALAGLFYGRRQVAALAQELRGWGACAVHGHNLLPGWTPAVWEAARAAGLPLVQTLHNHRYLASATHLLAATGARLPRDPAEALHLRRLSPLHGGWLVDRIYRSALQRCWTRGAMDAVSAWIVHSGFHRDLLVAAGIPAQRIVVRLHALDHRGPVGAGPGDHVLFVGRLAAEKGLDTIAAAWRLGAPPLRIAGSGPAAAAVAGLAGVELLGTLPASQVAERLASARLLVLASRVYEGGGLPLVAVEALAAGTPVLAPDLGPLSGLIAGRGVGWCYPADDPAALASAVARAWDEAPALRARCRTVFAADHDPARATARLLAVYGALAAGRGVEGI
jgi:glycosyltransferase involved in cell wall biosynthesis